MAEQISLALPPLTKYNGVPRRYEETKPAIIQDFSHRRILGLGHEIHLKLQGEAEEERLASVHATEEAVRKEAQALHEQEVLRVREEARLELERVVQKLKKEHDQALKKEALRVEMAMQKSALELVRQERVEAEKTLKDALAEAEVRMTSYREEVVRAVMEQEKRAAALEAARLAREHEETVRRVKEQASKELEETIARLTGAKDTAIQEAVTSAEKREQLKHAEDLAAAIVSYDLDLAKIRIEMDIQLNEINRLLAKIEEKEKSKQRLHEELQKTRRSFQDYITRVGKFTEGHANFMIKPLSESVLQLADEP